MEWDLKSLQQKISALESKLQFTHNALEQEPTSIELKKNVHFCPESFHSLNDEVFKHRVSKPEPKKEAEVSQKPTAQPKKIKLEVDLNSLTKKRGSTTDEDKFGF